ncbi:MAG: hypothetical protein ACE14L_13055 [Terriglobales bacterium]
MKLSVRTDHTTYGGHDLYDCKLEVSRHGGNVQISITNCLPGAQQGGSLEITRATAKKLAYALLFAVSAGANGTASLDVKEVPDWEPAHSDAMDTGTRATVAALRD